MVSVRAAKAKGSSHEYDCQESLQPIYPLIYRTSERGFQLQYDLRSDCEGLKAVFECKRLKSLSWNQAKKFFEKLEKVAPEGYSSFLLFKSNRQPCLVMYQDIHGICVRTFEDVFKVPFLKHKSTRVRK